MSSPAGPKRIGVDPVGGRLERARDDLVRRPVAAHRVDGDADGHGSTERGVRSGSTSRPRYVLQVGQTRCGSFGWPQFGQTFTRGAAIPCFARRLSRRDFEVFFLGTAIGGAV